MRLSEIIKEADARRKEIFATLHCDEAMKVDRLNRYVKQQKIQPKDSKSQQEP